MTLAVSITDPLYTSGTTGRSKGVIRHHDEHAVALKFRRSAMAIESGFVRSVDCNANCAPESSRGGQTHISCFVLAVIFAAASKQNAVTDCGVFTDVRNSDGENCTSSNRPRVEEHIAWALMGGTPQRLTAIRSGERSLPRRQSAAYRTCNASGA